MQEGTQQGLIVRSQSGFFTIRTGKGQVTARLRGRLKQGQPEADIAAVGDWVEYSLQEDGSGMIEAVEERQRALTRMAPTARGEYRQVIIANPDEAVFVFACAEPEPRLRMLDRFLVIAEQQGIPAIIVANKIDLVSRREARSIFGHYPRLGYEVFYTSAKKRRGLFWLKRQLRGKLSVFAGPSGVGKSSLLNVLLPGLEQEVAEVREATGKGRHTTQVREMFPLKGGGYLADTPGLKALALWDIEPEEIDGYFPEIAPLVPDCQFSDCTHLEEPDCAVIRAVERGDIHPQRYESYVRLRMGETD